MRKLMGFVMPIKTYAALIFTGLICLYMISGVLYAQLSGAVFSYTIPFVFVLQGLVLSLLISILWSVFISDVLIKKLRFFARFLLFGLSLLVLLSLCLLTFLAVPTNWAKLWLIVIAAVVFGIVILSCLSEMYYRKTGKLYTEALALYKAEMASDKER
jgi:phosphoglycerol transferase MdoB-like AlkP superfamily enzyme